MQNKPGTASAGTQINDKLRGPGLVYSTHFPCCTCSYSLGLERPPSLFFYFLSPSFILLHAPPPPPPSVSPPSFSFSLSRCLFKMIPAFLKLLRQNQWDTPWKHNLWVYNWCLRGAGRAGSENISGIREGVGQKSKGKRRATGVLLLEAWNVRAGQEWVKAERAKEWRGKKTDKV